MSDNNTVTLGSRAFELHEPSTATVLSILNVIGSVGMRAEKLATDAIRNPSSRAVMFALVAIMSPDDLVRLGIAVLQVAPGDKDTVDFIKANLKVAPLVQALFINLNLSTDLTDALGNFFGGIGSATSVIERIRGSIPVPVSSAPPESTA